MQAQMIPTSRLRCNEGQLEGLPSNPRYIKDEKFELLKRSLQESPEMLHLRELLVYPHEDTYIVIGGNMRLRAAEELGIEELPCKVLPVTTPGEKLREYTIKDNNGYGDYDWDILANEWDEMPLADWGVDMPAFEEMDDSEEESPTVEEDDFDEESDTVVCRCKRGDVWQLGKHRVMCGDSTSEADVNRLRGGGELADLLLTDPPYNVNYEGKTKDALKIANDKMGNDMFRAFLVAAFKAADTAMKAGAGFYIWHADSEGYNFRGACADIGWKVRQCLIWNKNAMVLGRQDYQWKHEPCLYGWKEGAGHYFIDKRNLTTVIDENKPMRNGEHPTMKPVPLFAQLIENSSKENGVVLDMFGGSGTTLIACEQLNRKCLMMELDTHYCDVIIARWEKLTGQTAIKIE
ncbi:MAG: DNA methyltransferase [Bacteroidaceae bacterium]|nr:DNA methyltransferase [Bacteroidaceae bacterium]